MEIRTLNVGEMAHEGEVYVERRRTETYLTKRPVAPRFMARVWVRGGPWGVMLDGAPVPERATEAEALEDAKRSLAQPPA